MSKEVEEKIIDLADESVSYTGWRLYNNVVIIEQAQSPSFKAPEGYIPKVYVADASDKKQINTGRNWASYNSYDYDTKQTKVIPGKEYTFENKGFTLCLSDSPANSWQGGKLSFCMCIIKKDGHVWQTGIASELLINLLKQSDCLKGEVQGEICFARNKGRLGMVLVGSESYNNAIQDDQIRKKISKTKKAKLGYEHKSLTQNNVWLCDVYNWIESEDMYVTASSSYRYGRVDHWFQKLHLTNTPKLEHIYVNIDFIGRIGYRDKLTVKPESPDGVYTMDEVVQTAIKSFTPSDSGYYWPQDMFYYAVDHFPARAIGRQIIRGEMTKEQYKEYMKAYVSYCERLESKAYNNPAKINKFSSSLMTSVIGRTLEKKRPIININDLRKWLDSFNGYIIVEVDGTEYMSKDLKDDLDRHEAYNLRKK